MLTPQLSLLLNLGVLPVLLLASNNVSVNLRLLRSRNCFGISCFVLSSRNRDCCFSQRRRLQRLSLMTTPPQTENPEDTYLKRQIHTWQVGDHVTVIVPFSKATSLKANVRSVVEARTSNQQERYNGIIRQTNRGWYTIEIMQNENDAMTITDPRNAKTSSIKCRASQLQKLVVRPTTKGKNNVSAFDLPQLVQQPQLDIPSIIKLDALIQKSKTIPYDIGLNCDIEQMKYFETMKEWVVFTDLHCSPHTIETCIQVLKQVHTIAQQRNAGILFLGDFWHIRSHTLRIDCLNRILDVFQQHYTQPTILIPGNHDQISSSVSVEHNIHSLTPLQNAFRITIPKSRMQNYDNAPIVAAVTSISGILILSQPTIFMNALFIPYIRSPSILDGILQETFPNTASKPKCPQAIFCHVDVSGASMNDNVISRGGISIQSFPPNIPIYSGHFHKPHTVTSSRGMAIANDGNQQPHEVRSVEYLGSPYQVSLSEAQQEKSLVVLDSTDGWKCVDRIPIHVGRRHFRPQTLPDFLALQLSISTSHVEDQGEIVTSDRENEPNFFLQSGDRVVFSIHKHELDTLRRDAMESTNGVKHSVVSIDHNVTSSSSISNALDEHINLLRNSGVIVEIRELTTLPESTAVASIHENDSTSSLGKSSNTANMKDDMSPLSLWVAFISREVQRGAISESSQELLLSKGKEILDEIGNIGMDGKTSTMTSPTVTAHHAKDSTPKFGESKMSKFQLYSVTVRGFGPFRDEFTYPLFNRGLVLLRGSNKDGGSDSNGTGKTSLAMSILWVFTGSIDPRPLQDSKVSDVVNDASKAAIVTVDGALNGVDFSISRTKTATKGSLDFVFGGKDLSRQSIKDTQDMINEKLGISSQVLARTMFHGQHALNELLDATDTKLKDELSLVVPLAVWQEALLQTRQKLRQSSKRVSELDGMILIRSEDAMKFKTRLDDANLTYTRMFELYEETMHRLKDEIASLPAASPAQVSTQGYSNISLVALEDDMIQASKLIIAIEKELKLVPEQRDIELKALESKIDNARSQINNLDTKLRSVEQECNEATVQLALAKERITYLQDMWKLDLSTEIPKPFMLPNLCPTCQQPISSQSGDDGHYQLESTVKHHVESSLSGLSDAQTCLERVNRALTLANSNRLTLIANLTDTQTIFDEKRLYWGNVIQEIENRLLEARRVQQVSSTIFADTAKQIDEESKIVSLEAKINMAKETLDVAASKMDIAQNEWSDCQQLVAALNLERMNETNVVRIMDDLCDAFGPRGIQTFIMQGAVSMLDSSARSYLDELSEGAQRLELTLGTGDCIARRAYVRGENGVFKERALASLSGGQWRRCSLALTLAFADLVANRANFRPSICVLDEPLLHLDQSGRANVGRVLRTLLRRDSEQQYVSAQRSIGFQVSTILIILQDLAADELEESFDCIDEVVKDNGVSTVLVNE